MAAEIADDLLQLDDRFGFHYFFGLSYEENLPTWYISCLLFFCAILLALTALQERIAAVAGVWHWWGLAAVFAYISLDEFAQLHEEVSNWVDFESDLLHFGWVVPAAALVLLVGLLYLPFLGRLPAATRRRFVLAGAIYVGAAIGMELPLGYWASLEGRDNLVYGLIDWVEETLEIVGISIFFYALVAHICGDEPILRITLGGTTEPSRHTSLTAPVPSFGIQILRCGAIAVVILMAWLAAMQLLQYHQFGRRLTEAEVRATVADRTLFGAFADQEDGPTPWVQYFASDGRVVFFMEEELVQSAWTVADGLLCFRSEVEGETLEDCLILYDKDGTLQFVLPTFATFGLLVATAERSAAGNVEGIPLE